MQKLYKSTYVKIFVINGKLSRHVIKVTRVTAFEISVSKRLKYQHNIAIICDRNLMS